MKLSISNIAWQAEEDQAVYKLMREKGYSGLEIAPTRIFSEKPYERLEEAKVWSKNLKENESFLVSSMQSIWFGCEENIFKSEKERCSLFEYTKKAIDFAQAIGCKNIVFGCPRNRNIPDGVDKKIAIPFFKELGDYAAENGTVIGMEANPTIYDTNYINDTAAAFELIKEVDSVGFKLNFDMGTVIENNEKLHVLAGNINFINHVHISEPGLNMIEKRNLHVELKEILEKGNYQKFVSVEMGSKNTIEKIEQALEYVSRVFG